MPVISSPARELLVVEMTSSLTTTSTAADGASLSTAWSGNFTVASKTNIEIEVHAPSATHNSTEWVGLIAWLDGATNLGTRLFWPLVGSLPGPISGKWRTTLSAGSHSIEMRGKVGAAGTGTFAMSSTDKGLLIVREVS